MSTAIKIDFDPALFGDSTDQQAPSQEEAHYQPRKKKAQKTNTGRILAVLALFAAAGAAAYLVINRQADTSPIVETPFLLPTANQPKAQPVVTTSARSCYGDETICTTAVTDRPTDMMTSLVAMLPKAEKNRRYRVSVVIEELAE
ncbi:TPA: hypothetical protein NIJ57_005772 [Pseudomonas aeruginosa]|nr:hypothetical protein [Pseudomonas aeruginosa]HBO9987779.1 hypothetical protein [Pseudomonas aeruginosa]HCE6109761.1 hypothetical protein [Pseudomonas aeruginosa]HCF7333089.1 hypothetical protein [Pseudomonas aeruginosa]